MEGDGNGSAEVGVECFARAMVVGGGVLGGFLVDGATEGFGFVDVGQGLGVGCEGQEEWEDSEPMSQRRDMGHPDLCGSGDYFLVATSSWMGRAVALMSGV